MAKPAGIFVAESLTYFITPALILANWLTTFESESILGMYTEPRPFNNTTLSPLWINLIVANSFFTLSTLMDAAPALFAYNA